MITVTIMRKTKKLKNMGTNIEKHGWEYSRWEFSEWGFSGGNSPGGEFDWRKFSRWKIY